MPAVSHIDRTIATVRNHNPEQGWWVSAAQALADEVERLRGEVATLQQLSLGTENQSAAIDGGKP